MKVFITDIVVNEEVTTYLMLGDDAQRKKTKKEKLYLAMNLIDKTGTVEGRLWEIPKDLDLERMKRGTVIKVRADVDEWNDKPQLQIRQIRIIDILKFEEEGIEHGDFFMRSEVPPITMFDSICQLLELNMDMDGHLYKLVTGMLHRHRVQLLKAPAAKRVHHAFIGGLLEHVLSLCRTALAVSPLYKLNTELMLTTCVLHDIGKIREMTYEFGIGYAVEGTLLGHICLGLEMVGEEIRDMEDFPQELRSVVLHMIASHHGLLEYGSPKVPLMKEAVVFHLLDMIDAKTAICDNAIKGGLDDDGLTAFSKELGGPLYKMKEIEDAPKLG